jgi:uncharacterized protein YvpB
MAKKQTSSNRTSRRRTTVAKTRVSSTTKKTPPKSSDFAIQRHQTRPAKPARPAKRRTRAELARRRRVYATIAVFLLVIVGVVAAKILADDTNPETNKPAAVNEVEPTKNIELPLKSEIELNQEKAEQNLSVVGGLLENSTFSADSIIKLKVPIYKQAYKQSCEAASLRMALSYHGIKTTDLDVLKLMKYDDQPAKKVDGKWQWGNPHQMFVGAKDGDQTKMTGYGVFGEPIAAASVQLGRPAAVQNEINAEWLARQIYAGNPIVLWGASVKIADAKWTTPDGIEITAPMRTHTRLVIGVKGDPNQPTGFYLNDPAGTEIYWTTAQLTANVAQGIGQAVAVY